MDQDNRDHKIRAPAMQGSYEPTQGNAVIEGLEAVPRLSRRRHVDQRKQYAGDNLEQETCERGAAENIEPACSLARNRVLGSLADRPAQLQPEVEPLADFLHQEHVVFPPALFATG